MEQIRLDLIPNGIMPNVHASQFDKSRTVRFNLYEGKTPFTLLATDNVKVTCNGVEDSTLATAGTSHDWTIPDAVVSDSGAFIGELSVERGSKVIGSKNFVLNVEEDAYNGKNIEERTASGTIANFETNLQDNLTACKCTINPLQSGTGTPSPSNPRPISGFSGANIVRCGVNLIKKQALMQFCPMASGTRLYAQLFDTAAAFSLYVVKKGLDPTITANWTSFLSLSTTKVNNTLPFDISHIGISSSAYSSLGTGNIMVSLNDITEFKPYIGPQYAPYFEGLLNGSYGFVDLGSLSWSYASSIFHANMTGENIKYHGLLVCPIYKNQAVPLSNPPDMSMSVENSQANPILRITNSDYTDATAFTNAMNGVYLIYELATPATPTITQSQIDTLINAFGDTCVCVVFGQEVYGGVLDVTNGKLTITHKGETFTSVVNGGASSTASWWGQLLSSGAKPTNNNIKADVKASYLETVTASQVISVENNSIGVNTNGAINIKIQGMTSLADYNTYLANNPLTVVYELATPTEITLTPKQIEAVVGINNVYHDCNGQTEVKYLVEV